MVMAADLSHRLGLIDAAYAQRITRLVERARLPIRGPQLGADRYLELMRVDKKSEAGEIRFVVIEAPGRAALRPAPDDIVREVLAAHAA
jgi:3-dehydroquinate synthase